MWETWVRKIPWKREMPPTPVFWPGESHGHGMSCKELDTTDQLSLHFKAEYQLKSPFFFKTFWYGWTIFKVFIEFVTVLLLLYVLVFWTQGMWYLSSPTRDRTCTPCIGLLNHWTTRDLSFVIDHHLIYIFLINKSQKTSLLCTQGQTLKIVCKLSLIRLMYQFNVIFCFALLFK